MSLCSDGDGKRLSGCFDVSGFCLGSHVIAQVRVKRLVVAIRDGSE